MTDNQLQQEATAHMQAQTADFAEEQKAYSYSNGCHYDGMWRANRRHGNGTFTWPSGALYKGEFKNDRRNGSGEINYSDGSKYTGEWRND